ncbi:MAG: multifunctional oxoglutarate decarboxylase/oxoglutarate dehydrogenase thiamine pyrophosphate-binding subunit/dihydrolipoyllysine-residue succinyltransferase subunit, partial [Actinomycetota bacterium]|nr:multifunctional oxoglutarate decarboxylase/oxoglutarate dehydrogenase thiamine pyrophosphate-binding subunit/dihydrolipoyllysine-residue succinyltransferase subunit [Actinomycetota bacterium]
MAVTTLQVLMPEMGESVAEGTVLEWRKREGDAVEADETVVEVSTDKVDAEVPAPAAGTVVRVLAAEGDTVRVGQVLAEIVPAGAGDRAGHDDLAGTDDDGGGPADGAEGGQVLEVTMPAMGESVAEGTVLEWAKRPGERVEADETIVEISTDKVDAEVPSPAAGTLAETLAEPGDTVSVGQVLARVRTGPAPANGAAAGGNDAASGSRPAGDGSTAAGNGASVATAPSHQGPDPDAHVSP